jgi:hypothetical protein
LPSMNIPKQMSDWTSNDLGRPPYGLNLDK